jgi:ketol-acid reductoisomerase
MLAQKQIAILGYGNQGQAHALNLRDSGSSVVIGARPGTGFDRAKADGFSPVSFQDAVQRSEIIMLLLPDQEISKIVQDLQLLLAGKVIGLAHGFAYVFGGIDSLPNCRYFLAGPKGAGAILRARFIEGTFLPGAFAVSHSELKPLAQDYCRGIGINPKLLIETTFREETECDLFGEQAVLCGGIFRLMEMAFETLVKNGASREMAFLETCFEAKTILDLWMKYGPYELSRRISPTAFYGGLTRGKRVVPDEARMELEKIFQEVRSGEFAKEWLEEVENGTPSLSKERERLKKSELDSLYQKMRDNL